MKWTRRERLWLALAAWAAAVAALTLGPGTYHRSFTLERFLCVACGPRGASDVILNWLLFVPGGACLGALMGFRRALVVAALATVSLELVQFARPARSTALQDILANTLGAAFGAWVAARGMRHLRVPTVTVVALAWTAPAALLEVVPPQADIWAQWTPRFGAFEHYDGRLLEARVGGVEIPTGPVSDRAEARRAAADPERIDLVFVAGTAPPSLAPIFNLSDETRRNLLMVAVDQEDLVVHRWTLAAELRLDQPGVRWRRAMADVRAGDTVRLALDLSRGSVCARLSGIEECGLAPSPAAGWGFLSALDGLPGGVRPVFDLLWAAMLGVLIGLAAGGRLAAPVMATGVGLAGLGLGLVVPSLRPDPVAALLLPVGALAGVWLAARLVRAGQESSAVSGAAP